MEFSPEQSTKLMAHGLCIAPGAIVVKSLKYHSNNRIYSGRLTDCELGAYAYLVGGELNKVKVGRYSSLAHGVEIGFYSHPVDWVTSHPFSFHPYMLEEMQWPVPMSFADMEPKPVTIGNDVWVGAHVKIMGGVTIGDGAVIAVGSVVTKDIAPYTIVGGVPAKIIRPRFTADIATELSELQWWDYDWPKMLKDGKETLDCSSPKLAVKAIGTLLKSGVMDGYKINDSFYVLSENAEGNISLVKTD